MKKLLAVVCMLACLSSVSFAKASKAGSGEEKLGLGYNAQNGLNAISMRYWQKGDWGVEGMVGYNNTYDNNVQTLIGGKFLKPIKTEENLTVYGFGSLALLTVSAGGTSNNGTVLSGGLGVEFFFAGLPNLGFGAELGLTDIEGNCFPIGTKGYALTSSFLQSVGVRYYFK